ncbi:hypothetical protein SBA2_370004 [Acidobacteriia bacterium SbA2]|nr:hypothetical protein SBA2_370004 [Acidobacteriia bacterium SbA2]
MGSIKSGQDERVGQLGAQHADESAHEGDQYRLAGDERENRMPAEAECLHYCYLGGPFAHGHSRRIRLHEKNGEDYGGGDCCEQEIDIAQHGYESQRVSLLGVRLGFEGRVAEHRIDRVLDALHLGFVIHLHDIVANLVQAAHRLVQVVVVEVERLLVRGVFRVGIHSADHEVQVDPENAVEKRDAVAQLPAVGIHQLLPDEGRGSLALPVLKLSGGDPVVVIHFLELVSVHREIGEEVARINVLPAEPLSAHHRFDAGKRGNLRTVGDGQGLRNACCAMHDEAQVRPSALGADAIEACQNGLERRDEKHRDRYARYRQHRAASVAPGVFPDERKQVHDDTKSDGVAQRYPSADGFLCGFSPGGKNRRGGQNAPTSALRVFACQRTDACQ